MGQHDVSYRTLFSHRYLVESLIRGFLPAEWIEGLDFTTLVSVSEAHPTDDWSLRFNDCVWRLRWQDEGPWLFIYLMLEFQSTDEPFMAVRIMGYEGLLYEHLIRALGLKREDELPAIIPVVLYNGASPWKSKTDVFDLIAPTFPGMSEYLPRLRYKVIDIRRLPLAELERMNNAVAGLFRLEASQSLVRSHAALKDLQNLLDPQEHATLRRDIARWICEVLWPSRMPGVNLKGARQLEEVSSMITENAWDWTAEWRMQGHEEGRKEGEAALLLRQVERKFGTVDAEVQRKLRDADADQLLDWGDRFVDADSVEAIFADD